MAKKPTGKSPCKAAVWGSRGEWYCLKHGTADPDPGCPKGAEVTEEQARERAREWLEGQPHCVLPEQHDCPCNCDDSGSLAALILDERQEERKRCEEIVRKAKRAWYPNAHSIGMAADMTCDEILRRLREP